MIYIVHQCEGDLDVNGVRYHLKRHSLEHQVLDAFTFPRFPALHRGDAVIGLGGPPSVVRLGSAAFDTRDDFVAYEAGFVEYVLLDSIPYLGFCLSHQLRARVSRNPVEFRGEVFGLNEIVLNAEGRAHWLFEGMPERFCMFEHHEDQVTGVDSDGVLLAGSADCPVEAVAWGDVGATVQFHPEGLEADLERILGGSPQSLENTGLTLEQMMARLHADYTQFTERFFDNFLFRAGCIQRV